ncbi:hypothetical protein [Sutcliffiella deserti]|uniref:hypothetical protein n=1 Tax=Sutcliffiella deserti TaxID=2875501 RepID=UPI001CBAA8CD|nr:hypothetical protein [Sutcliffiella deserti]
MSDSTLQKKSQNLMEKSKYAQDGSSLEKDAKGARRVNRHLEREKVRKEQKNLQPAYEVFVNDKSFRVTGVNSETEAIDKLSKWSAFHNMVNKMKEKEEDVNIHAQQIHK